MTAEPTFKLLKEYQFRVPMDVWLDVHAETLEEAVKVLNSQLPLFEVPLQAPGLVQRALLDVKSDVSAKDVVTVYNFRTGEHEDPANEH